MAEEGAVGGGSRWCYNEIDKQLFIKAGLVGLRGVECARSSF